MPDVWSEYAHESSGAIISAFRNGKLLETVAGALCHCIKENHRVLIAGNGGSAADSLHLAAEFVGRFRRDRRPLPAISLAADTAAVTAISNDYGYEEVFARQVEALGQVGDVLLVMTTSGRSPNVLKAVRRASNIGMVSIALVGRYSDEFRGIVDFVLDVDSDVTSHIQEAHIAVGHALCLRLEELLNLSS
jgi:D-sedoheptulose 7-phosphate isomerase